MLNFTDDFDITKYAWEDHPGPDNTQKFCKVTITHKKDGRTFEADLFADGKISGGVIWWECELYSDCVETTEGDNKGVIQVMSNGFEFEVDGDTVLTDLEEVRDDCINAITSSLGSFTFGY